MPQDNSAIDIIYSLPEVLSKLLSKVESLETRSAILEQKLNLLINSPNYAAPIVSTPLGADAESMKDDGADSASEVMEIRQPASQPFAFDKKVDARPEPSALTLPQKPADAIRIPSKEVDPMPQNAIPAEPVSEKQTATLIRGRLKEREGSSIAAVDVKIFDEKSVMVKKTKTAATGEWIAMLPSGEYTVEFTKPGQKPLFKPITVVSGKKELEILI